MKICEICRKEYAEGGIGLNFAEQSFTFCSQECFAKAKKNKNIINRLSKAMRKEFPATGAQS
jgi:hypothetical protein